MQAEHGICARLSKGIYDIAASADAGKAWSAASQLPLPDSINQFIQSLPSPPPPAQAGATDTGTKSVWSTIAWIPSNDNHLRPTLILSCGDTAFVVTRGSVDAIDWATNFCYTEQTVSESHTDGKFTSHSVHAGFHASASATIKVMQSFDWSKFKRLWITGHSLGMKAIPSAVCATRGDLWSAGGAISTLACFGLNAADPQSKYDSTSRYHCVSFGGPATASIGLCERLNEVVTVYVHGDDCVPRTGVIRHMVNAANTHASALASGSGGSESPLHLTVMTHSTSNQFYLAGRCVHLTLPNSGGGGASGVGGAGGASGGGGGGGGKVLRSRESFRSFHWSTKLIADHSMIHYLNCFL